MPRRCLLAALVLACTPASPPGDETAGTGATVTGTTGDTGGESETAMTPTTGEPLTPCDEVCDEPRTIEGDLQLFGGVDPEMLRCVQRVTGTVSVGFVDGPLPPEFRSLQQVGQLFV